MRVVVPPHNLGFHNCNHKPHRFGNPLLQNKNKISKYVSRNHSTFECQFNSFPSFPIF